VAAQEGVLKHIVVPEGLNRDGSLSAYYRGCVEAVAAQARSGETVYMAPGNSFGHSRLEEEVAAQYLREARPDLDVQCPAVTRSRYLDTLDNAIELRRWAEREGQWPIQCCVLYCNRYHLLRVKLCFRRAGYAMRRVVATTPRQPAGHIVPRLWYYDHAAANICYEALAIGYTTLRLAGAR